MTRGLLLVGHGSREAAGNRQFLALAATLASALAGRLPDLAVEPCFLDHAEPGIQAGIDRLAERGATDIAVVPLFLFAAGHAKRDVPDHLEAARRRYPAIAFRYGRVLGVEPALVRTCAGYARAAEAKLAPRPPAATALLLVGRGSSDPEANAGLADIASRLAAATGYGLVAWAYCDVANPPVAEGLDQCLRSGARRVILLPYFLFRGVLMDRLATTLAEWQFRHPAVEFLFAGAEGLAQGRGMLELVLERTNV